MPKLSLQNADARLVQLALVYHLGRPGSEIDARTLQQHELGLRSVHEALGPQLSRAVAELELTDYQLTRLGQALHGTVNELKQFGMAQGRSAVPGFTEAAHQLFAGLEEAPGDALDLAGQAVMLRRRIDAAVRDAEAAVAAALQEQAAQARSGRRPWWRRLMVWQR